MINGDDSTAWNGNCLGQRYLPAQHKAMFPHRGKASGCKF